MAEFYCNCRNVSEETVRQAIANGADTVEKVGEATQAGTGCGRCKSGIQALIDNA